MRAPALTVLAFLAIPAMAGCLATPPNAPAAAPGASLPFLFCTASDRCNFDMTPTPGRQGNEVTIAVNPKDPHNVVGGAKDYYPDDAGDCVWDGVYVAHDGSTYADRSFDGSPWRQLQHPDPSKLNYASQFWCTTDPVAYFDLQGNLYYVLMAYQADRVTGSKTCKDTCPQGALNDWAFNRATQIVAISHDGGDTFDTFTPVEEGSYPVNFHDKAWIAAQDDGSAIHIVWLSSLAGGNQYWRSVDGGKTYQDPQLFSTTATDAGQGSFVDVGPGAQVYVAWSTGTQEMLVRSKDKGATWDTPRAVLDLIPGAVKGLSDRDRRNTDPSMATDRFPDSPRAGAVYFVWADGRDAGDPANVYFAASHDGGATFTTPLRLNDDTGKAAQFLPAVSVSPGGVIDVTWMDQREDPDGLLIDQYYTYSLDGGRTWAPNLRVRDAHDPGWDPRLSHHQNGKVFLGDYLDIDSSWLAAHPVWPDTRSGSDVKVYTATVLRPLFADGWDAAKTKDARTHACTGSPEATRHPACAP